MPTYEYRCAKCGQHFDVYQSFSEDPLTKHEKCGGKLTKVISPAGIVLKGSGFYKTDNRSGSKTATKERSGDSAKESSSSASSKDGSSSKSDASSSSSSGSSGSSGEAKSA
jgi:putative FmdB family regulatory protein